MDLLKRGTGQANYGSRDPFAVDPLPKAHYYPSPKRKLSHTQKGTAIHPSQLDESENREEDHKYYDNEKVGHMNEVFLKETNTYQPDTVHHDISDGVDFDESWPTSEKPSYTSLTEDGEEGPEDPARFQALVDRFANLRADRVPDHEMPASLPQRPQNTRSAKFGATTRVGAKSDNIAKDRQSKKISQERKADKSDMDEKPSESVLQRYIERFRNSAPMSREDRDRQQHSNTRDFWWLSSSPSANMERPRPSTARPDFSESREEIERDSYEPTPVTAENLNKYNQWQDMAYKQHPRQTYDSDPHADKKIIELQERAERLVEKSSSTVLSADPAVSTDGLGSAMSDAGSIEEYPYRPAFTAYLERERAPVRPAERRYPGPGGYKGGGQDKQAPEDDPLQQWRLRRKMDIAQEAPTKNVQSFGFLAKSEKEREVDEQLHEFKSKLSGKSKPGAPLQTRAADMEFTPAPKPDSASYEDPGTVKSRPQIASPLLHKHRMELDREVDPHMHLLCDLLPCPYQGKYASDLPQRGQASQQDIDKHSHGANRTQYLQAEKPDSDRVSDRVSEAETESQKTQVERNKKIDSDKQNSKFKQEKDIENKLAKQKEVRINDSDDSLHSRKEQRRGRDRRKEGGDHDERLDEQEERMEKESSKRLPQPRQSSSPKVEERLGLDQAIGQAVKNHLFSSVMSSVDSVQSSVERLPPSSGHRMYSLPEQSDTQADDSDESDGEFSDDPLLQMLRRQKAMFEQKLQEIDRLLEGMDSR